MKKFSYNISKTNPFTDSRKLIKVTITDNREKYHDDVRSLKEIFISLQRLSSNE